MSSSTQQYPTNPYSVQATLGPPNKPPNVSTGRSGGGGWKWLIIIFGILGLGFVACCGLCGGAIYFLSVSIEQSTPYKMAMEKVRESVEVKDKLGAPVEDSPILNGSSTKFENGDKSSHFSIKVTGPNGEATVVVDASAKGEEWKLDKCTITFADGTKHDFLGGEEKPEGEEAAEMKEAEAPAEGVMPAP